MLVLSLFNPRFFRPNWHPPAPPTWRDSQSAHRGWRRRTDMDGHGGPRWSQHRWSAGVDVRCYYQWIGLRENLQDTMVFTIKYRAFL